MSGALTLPVAPRVAPSRIVRPRRDFGAGIGAQVERQARAARQRIQLLMAEGAERLQLEARFEVANRFADEQIRLSAALVTAQGSRAREPVGRASRAR